jgi:hypothetical protein
MLAIVSVVCLIAMTSSGCDVGTLQAWTASRDTQWKFHPGDRFVCETSRVVHESTVIPALLAQYKQPALSVKEQFIRELWTVVSVDQAGTAKIQRRFDLIRSVESSPIFVTSFDSSDTQRGEQSVSDEYARLRNVAGANEHDFALIVAQNHRDTLGDLRHALKPVIGSGDVVHVSKRGELLDSHIPATVAQGAVAPLTKFLSDRADLKALCLQMTGALPSGAKKDAGWQASLNDPSVGKIVLEFTHQGTVDQAGTRLVQIAIKGHDDERSTSLESFRFAGTTLFDDVAGNVTDSHWESETVTAARSRDGNRGERRVIVTHTVKIERL